MNKFNSYWPVYQNFEEEVLELSKYINFSDDQVEVYSMYIADLIMRIAVEIEALSKELYKKNGGEDVFDEEGKSRFLYFDSDCINYLDKKWKICNRQIIVSCANFIFEKDDNKIIMPLKNANKNGQRSVRWNRAYQALKHDRRVNLVKGNIGNLIQALGALYILNLYFRDEIFDYGSMLSPNNFFDNRLGSKIFAATYVDATKAVFGGDATDESIISEEKEKLSSALCIIKFNDEGWKAAQNEMDELNNKFFDDIENNSYYIEKVKRLEQMDEKERNEAIGDLKLEYMMNYPTPIFNNLLSKGKREIVLNKGQVIYKEN